MERGWDPEVKRFFRKIMGSIGFGLLWMMACATAGIYFQLGFIEGKLSITNIIFYSLMLITLLLLIRYFYRTWRK